MDAFPGSKFCVRSFLYIKNLNKPKNLKPFPSYQLVFPAQVHRLSWLLSILVRSKIPLYNLNFEQI